MISVSETMVWRIEPYPHCASTRGLNKAYFEIALPFSSLSVPFCTYIITILVRLYLILRVDIEVKNRRKLTGKGCK